MTPLSITTPTSSFELLIAILKLARVISLFENGLKNKWHLSALALN